MRYAKLKEALREAAWDHDVEVREDYSGRGMYGARCFGLVADEHDLWRLVMQVAVDLETPAPHPSMDAMGLGVIWYWPQMRTEEAVVSERADEEGGDR